jgi:poly-gamma-glutamate synthesis protein (capsule biosynthesis protein)
MESKIKIILGGDVMLGRLVKGQILKHGPDYPLGPIANVMRQADLTIVNLECAITASEQEWSGAFKAFYFGASPEAAESLAHAGVDLVSLANNHSLDYDIQGLKDTFHYLQKKNIKYAGAGNNIDEALTPAILECKGLKFGMAAFCDHQPDFAATSNRPGMAYLDLNNEKEALVQIASALEKMKQQKIDYPILSLHWGPNMVHRPSKQFVRIAHAVIDMGYKMLFGHSAHVFQGIEIYRGCPIFYAAGDLVDDYYVDPEFRNDHQLLFELELLGTSIKKIFLYPVFIEQCRVQFAQDKQFEFIADRAKELCQEMGTIVNDHNQNKLVININ